MVYIENNIADSKEKDIEEIENGFTHKIEKK